jgi:hypothetical protein
MGVSANGWHHFGVKNGGAGGAHLKRPIRVPAAAEGHDFLVRLSSDF